MHYAILAGMKLALTFILVLIAFCPLPAAGEESAQYYHDQGQQLSLNGSFKEAIASYDRSLDLEPSNERVVIDKGLALSNLAQFEDAIMFFDQALKLNSSNADAWYFKGMAQTLGLADYEVGISSLDQALALNPNIMMPG